MKRSVFSLMLACVLVPSLEAQTNSQSISARTNAPAARVAPTIVARSLNSRTWARIVSQTNAAGRVSTVTNKAYTELASGLCYETNGQLVDAAEAINIVADGASATQAQHKVHFAGNANTAGGAVKMKSRDGKTFATRVYGLSYWDPVSGTNLLLATLQDSRGTVVSNRVVYTNAFQGLNADIEYVFTKAGLEQNIILRERLPTPESVGTGLASASTRLQVLTEFISTPEPNTNKTQVVNGIQEDVLLDFGAMRIGMGNAFLVPGQPGSNAVRLGRVSKHWRKLDDGRHFLFEEVPFRAISNAVRNLPAHASAAGVGTAVKHLASLEPLLPLDLASNAAPMTMQLAKAMPERPGVVLDYMELNGCDYYDGSVVFQGDTTYYISGFLGVWDAVFEGGTVVKFESSYGYPFIYNYGDSPCQFNGSAYRPVVFTSSDDNSVGDTISGSSGNPSCPGYYVGYFADYIFEDAGGGGATNVTVSHVRFSYAGKAYEDEEDTSHIFTDCQFVQCGGAFILSDASLYLGNDLFSGCGDILEGNSGIVLDAENITADSITGYAPWNNAGGGITNSILTACGSGIYNFNLDHTVVADSGSGIYQSVGDGNYYLAPSTFQGAGTTNINPSLLADLRTKTTYPPVVYASTTIGEPPDSYGIAAPRDVGNPGPDRGYHYDPLDYVFGGVIMGSSTTFANGVVAGWYNDGSGYGIYLGGYWQVATFQGTAGTPGWWVRANTVQESGGNTVWPGAGAAGGLLGEGCPSIYSYNPAQVNLLFTHCSILAGGDGGPLNHFAQYTNGSLVVNATNSEFYSGNLFGFGLSGNFMNCLMDRVNAGQYDGDAWTMTNCTWYGGSLTLTNDMYIVRDSAFDGTIINAPSNQIFTNLVDFNAFGDGAVPFPAVGASNVYLPSQGTNMQDFNWQSSVLGNYYLPPDSPLIAAGDMTADQLGLSSFTTQTNQTSEASAVVDIGYHYMACPQSACISEAGGQLSVNSHSFAIGVPAFVSATWTDVPGVAGEGGFDANGNWVMTRITNYSTILTNWNTLDWDGSMATNGGSGYFFTPTNTEVGTNVFYYTYSNSPPCGGTHTISTSNGFYVVAVASLAPANTGNWIEISNNTPGTRIFLVQPNPTNGPDTLTVYANPIPALSISWMPDGWSLNGARAMSTNLNISGPAVYEVDCVCGTSALTDLFFVTTNQTLNTGLAYSNGTGPNNITFQIGFTNQYVNLTNVPLSLGIQGGVPYYYAVQVDNTNFGGATWMPYMSSNIFANLGTNEGWHTVWVGLRGLPADAQPTWNSVGLCLMLTPPTLVVTNATNVTIPMLQLQGYANAELAGLTFDLVNTNGAISNQTGFMTGATFDTNSFSVTNVTFQCFDLALASGVNLVTLHAADLAGNVGSACCGFNLNYSNKPAPGIQLFWPQDGAQIGAGSFTWRGAVDDPTVSLWATVADGEGDTNVVAGVVEREGNFWVENIPLYAGTNYLTLTATDIAGNVTNMSIAVVQSDVEIGIHSIWSDLNQAAAGEVCGTINSTNCALWVNGVCVTNFGEFGPNTWDVRNVPLNGAGRVVIQARAIPLTAQDNYGNGNGDGGGGTNSGLSNPGNPSAPDSVDVEMSQDKQPVIECLYFHDRYSAALQIVSWSNTSDVVGTELTLESADWTAGTGGSAQYSFCGCFTNASGDPDYEPYILDQWQWDANGNGFYQLCSGTNGCGAVSITNAAGYYSGPVDFPGLQGNNITAIKPVNACLGAGLSITNSFGLFTQRAASGFCLPTTGGLSLSGAYRVHAISANAAGISSPAYGNAYILAGCWPIAPTVTYTNVNTNQVSVNNVTEDTNGIAWVPLPNGVPIYVRYRVIGAGLVSSDLTDTKEQPPQIYFNGTDVTGENVPVGFGQQISLTCTLPNVPQEIGICNWSFTSPTFSNYTAIIGGGPLITNFQAQGTNVTFSWGCVGQDTVTCNYVLNGQIISSSTTFNVIRLSLDVNHDGIMDETLSGQDNTSQSSPMEFWINNGPGDQNGVYHPSDYGSTNSADWQRNLENFARLWICGMPILPSAQGYEVALSITPENGNPAINLLKSVESNGGIGYLTNTNVAAAQAAPGLVFGTVTNNGGFLFPRDFFDGTDKYFLFEGAGTGEGQLTLTIYQNGNVIAQTSQWMDLHDIRDVYERAVITNNEAGVISNWSSAVAVQQPAIANLLGNDSNIIVFIHGIAVGKRDWIGESGTVLKRLYWAGYQGKFATVDWPCKFFNWSLLQTRTSVFNVSEVSAYTAGSSLNTYLSGMHTRFPSDRLNLFVHSQGNAVVGEAILEGAPFDTYILTQGAMPDSAYDVSAPTDSGLLAWESLPGYQTPEWQPHGYHGIYTNFSGRIVNFYNANDPVLKYWITDQGTGKPNGYTENLSELLLCLPPLSSFYTYDGEDSWYHTALGPGSYWVADLQEERAMVSRSRTDAIGQSGPASSHGVIQSAVDLYANFGFYNKFPYDHSAQWTWPIQSCWGYYDQILEACLIPTIQR